VSFPAEKQPVGDAIMLRKISTLCLATAALGLPMAAEARDQIRIVGSSTVYPFVTSVAETFGADTDFSTPVVEQTGTGGGFKLFCSGIGNSYPDFSNASRAIKESEVENCNAAGIKDIVEIKIGYDGIVIANTVESSHYELTTEQIFLALAKKIPDGDKLIDNPYKKWNEIDASLPAVKIAVYGPPPTSGTRDAFVELVMEKECKNLPAFVKAVPDKKSRKKVCHALREDGYYLDSGENDNLIVQKLRKNKEALGIFGFSFLDQNSAVVQGSTVNGANPTFEEIASGDYVISRPLYVYMKGEHVTTVPGMKDFVESLVSDEAIGEEGYLTMKGLIPLQEDKLIALQEKVLR